MVDIIKMDMKTRTELGDTIMQSFRDERYVDPDGVVWVGFGEAPDEIWVQEKGGANHLNKTEMLLKMAHEIVGEQ